MSYTGIIKIPVLFDMSGDTIVYGEDVTGDFVTSHLDFILDMTAEANDISLNAADISAAILVGDQDNTDNLFYSGGTDSTAIDNLCNRISKAITRGKLVHIPKVGNHSNSGIPLGGRAELVDATGTHTIYHIQNVHTPKYFTTVAPIGDEQMLGEAMARVASIHLVGTPLAAAAFEDAASIQTSLETASAQTFNSGNTAFYNALAVQLSKVLGGSKSSAPMNASVTASIPGGDLASQNFSINFDSLTVGDSYNAGGAGASSTSTVVDGTNASHPDPRVSGSLYLRTATSQYNAAKIYYGSTTTRAISFWHHFTLSPPPHADAGKVSLIGGLYSGDTKRCSVERRGRGVAREYIGTFPAGEANVQWWVDGVKQSYVEAGSPGQWYLDASNDGWHHHYIDLGPGYTANDITQVRMGSHKAVDQHWGYQNYGFFDDFRFFDERLTDAQIIDLAAGNNGNPGGGTVVRQPLDASGTSVPALKSIYEQLMNVPGRSQIMQTRDISGVVDNSNTTLTGGFPFISGDKLVMYLRPKIVFGAQTVAEQNNSLITASGPTTTTIDVPVYDIGLKSSTGGTIAGQIYTNSSSHNDDDTWGFHTLFEDDDVTNWTTSGDANHIYSTTSPFSYTGDQKTINIDGSSELLGEWGQIDIGQNTVVNKFQIWPRGSYRNSRSPSDFSLLGSLDGTNWTTIKAVSGLYATDWNLGNGNTPDGTITWVLDSVHGPYRYYRLSVSSRVGSGDARLSLTGLKLYGAKSPSEVTIGNTGAVSDISGIETNIVATPENIEDAFPGNATTGPEPEMNKWGWMGSPNSDSLTLESTDVTDIRTIDLHIWKITITL